MRQRNTSGYGRDVMAWPTDEHPDRRPFFVAPDEETDFPELLAGFTAVETTAEQEPPSAGAAKTKKTAGAAPDTASQGGEPA